MRAPQRSVRSRMECAFWSYGPSAARPILLAVMPARIDPTIQRRAKWRNFVNTWLIATGLVALHTLCAWLLLGTTGVIWALVLGAFMLITGPRFSPALILRLCSFGAKPKSRLDRCASRYTYRERISDTISFLQNEPNSAPWSDWD